LFPHNFLSNAGFPDAENVAVAGDYRHSIHYCVTSPMADPGQPLYLVKLSGLEPNKNIKPMYWSVVGFLKPV
jgi:hypothetical protein